jgi:hypothetical protein
MQRSRLYFKFLNFLSMFNSFFKLVFCVVSDNLPPKSLGGSIVFFLIDLTKTKPRYVSPAFMKYGNRSAFFGPM